jgi:MinD-like ATPase involved in chromosome partitioning or flagellar assembly
VGPVHFTDGFDRPDTIALGLDAPRLIAVVIGALSAYAVMQSPLPMALRIGVAVLVAAVTAVLGWARYAGRPVLTWAWLALRFTLSPQSGGGVVQVQVAAPAATTASERTLPAQVPAVVAPEPPVPAEPGVPVWAQWLQYETLPHAKADTAPPGTVETAREAPLVVVIDQAAAPVDHEGATGAEPLPRTNRDSIEPPTSGLASGHPGNRDIRPAPDEALQIPSDGDLRAATDGGLRYPSDDEEQTSPDGALPYPGDDSAVSPRAEVLPYPSGDGVERPGHGEVLHLPIARPDVLPVQPAAHPTPHDTPPPVFVGAPRRITFFSLNGGAGRTTLATEVACILAARGRHLAADGTVRPLNVALLDLDLRSASISVRLGIPHPTLADYVTRGAEPAHLDACMVRHPSGVHALLGLPKPIASGTGALEPARVAEIVHRLERDGAQFVIVDVAADLDAVTTWVLSAVHDIFVVLTPTAGGVQDAYRTTAALRRLGLGHKLRYVVNRARGDVDLSEVMGDLGGRIAAVIPYDPAIEESENNHRITALDQHSAAASALHDLAAHLYPSLSPAAQRSRTSWLRWRRRAG